MNMEERERSLHRTGPRCCSRRLRALPGGFPHGGLWTVNEVLGGGKHARRWGKMRLGLECCSSAA